MKVEDDEENGKELRRRKKVNMKLIRISGLGYYD